MNAVYRYYCRFRPPMPGAIPRNGLQNVCAFDVKDVVFDNVEAWGYADYDRPLTEKEINDYELAASPNNPLEYQ